jgi:hypothetical protein
MPISTPVISESIKANASVGQWNAGLPLSGNLSPANDGMIRASQNAMQTPAAPAMRLTSRLSTTNNLITLRRSAPSATRTAISRRRAMKRISSRLLTLLQAMSNTAPTAPKSTANAGRRFAATCSEAGTTVVVQLSLFAGKCSL